MLSTAVDLFTNKLVSKSDTYFKLCSMTQVRRDGSTSVNFVAKASLHGTTWRTTLQRTATSNSSPVTFAEKDWKMTHVIEGTWCACTVKNLPVKSAAKTSPQSLDSTITKENYMEFYIEWLCDIFKLTLISPCLLVIKADISICRPQV